MSTGGWVGDVTYVTVATRGPKRFFDLDAVRTAYAPITLKNKGNGQRTDSANGPSARGLDANFLTHAGAPPLDWHIDDPAADIQPQGDPVPIEYRVGDVFDRLKEIPDGSIDLIVTSPPFLALRSYLPADHPDKDKEIGAEATPAAFIDTLLRLTAEFGRVLAPHGSLCVELGDKYSGSGGAGGDYNANGLREGQSKFGSVAGRDGWPLAKSLTGIPQSYMLSLVYGWNVLDRHGPDSPAGRWRARNQIVWARPNPPVGQLADKFRPATSYITVACRGPRRFFDLDAVRTEPQEYTPRNGAHLRIGIDGRQDQVSNAADENGHRVMANAAGAPPLDWHTDLEDGDWLWKMATQPYKGAHYATFPLELPTRLIMAMCPLRVCQVCGKPSERIVDHTRTFNDGWRPDAPSAGRSAVAQQGGPLVHWSEYQVTRETTGWSDCGHQQWRTGVVLDPFCGSATTLEAAQNVGRHAIGIDLDERNADLARQRVGMFLDIDHNQEAGR